MSKVPGERSQICSKIPPPRTRTSDALSSSKNLDKNCARKEKYSTSSRSDYDATNGEHNNDNKSVQSTQIDGGKSSKQPSESSKSKYFSYRRGFGLMLPKININVENIGDKIVQNPRILDLRNKLNEINKKRERDVDKETKTLINDITQRLNDGDDQEGSESGPYSLLLDLHSDESTSKVPDILVDSADPKNDSTSHLKEPDKITKFSTHDDSSIYQPTTAEKKPNIITFQGKNLNEFEYFCENAAVQRDSCPKQPNRHSSRSDLCLHFTTQMCKQNKFDTTSPTTDSSLHRPNDENSLDDSLGILTPDQMDDMFSPTVEGLPVFGDVLEAQKESPDNGDSPSTDKTETNSAVSTMFMENEARGNLNQDQGVKLTDSLENKQPRQCSGTTTSLKYAQPELELKSSRVENSDVTMMPLDESALLFGGTESHDLFSPKTIDLTKETIFVPKVEEDLLPSIHSSILDPISSLVDTTINLELPLDSKHFENLKSQASQRIEQTPSPEDLPLDSSDLNGEPTTYSNSIVSGPTVHDSQTFSETKTDFVKSMETSKVSNSFVTSITSITSLDGYQGDGEMSRPVSRGADQSIGNREDVIEMDWQNVPVNRRPDPMTDSDFFTESDADGHDDHMHRGDRRAQVIDGALYGGNNNNNGPLIVNRNDDSCMESSGVFTDTETHRCSPVFLNAIDDLSPDGSSPSTRSECSQKNGSTGENNGIAQTLDDTLIGSARSKLSLLSNDDSIPSAEKGRIHLQKNNKNVTGSNEKLPKEEKRSFALKKYKMPKRDVPSKLKLMLARKPDSDASVENSPSSKMSKKNERREGTPKKLNLGDSKTKSFKDIKSKVDCCLSLQRSQTSCSVPRTLSAKSTATAKPKTRHMRTRLSELGSVVGSGKSSLHSSQSDLSAASSPPGKHAATRFPLTRSTKKRESVPAGGGGGGAGVASPRAPASPPAHAPRPPAHAKKNGVALPKLPASPVSARTRAAPSAAAAAPPALRRAPPARPTALPTAKEAARAGAGSVRGAAGKRAPAQPAPPPAPPAVAAATSPVAAGTEPSAALAHAAKGVEALGVLVQYLVCQLEALNGGGWRAEAARWRGLAAAERTGAARASHDHQQRAQKDLDTIGECLNKISELEMEVASKEEENSRLVATSRDAESQYRSTLQEIAVLAADIKGLKSTIGALKREVAESRGRVCAGADRERALAAQLEAARRDLASSQLERHPDLDKDKTELAAEVRSLRAVLELKQAETSSLRHARSSLAAETERRAAAERELDALRQAGEELRERAAARQRDADLLRDENRLLRECAARDRHAHARLALYNEELRYKLRQKSQVVSLLATAGGSAYLERSCSSPRVRAASCGSVSPPASPSPPGSPAAASPATPAVKGVVEKQDSVSWVLEIEESPEEVAGRLARRSGSFRAAGSPGGGGGGVKRRGGGSPSAPGSPAPASPAPNASKLFRCAAGERSADYPTPPLKESAGEAIYIYDNRQY